MSSASFDAWLRASSQPKTRIMIRYRRRKDTNRDLAPTRPSDETAGQHHCDEFWSGTSCLTASIPTSVPHSIATFKRWIRDVYSRPLHHVLSTAVVKDDISLSTFGRCGFKSFATI
jgi:hypothetical protein